MITKIVVLVMALFLLAGSVYAVDGDRVRKSDVSGYDPHAIPAPDSIPANTADQQSVWSNWTLSAGGYCQFQYHSNVMEQNTGGDVNFMGKRLRPYLRAQYKDHFTVYTQLQVGHPTLLLQLFADFPISIPVADSSLIRIGQFASSLMYLEPPAERKHFVDYGLSDFYIPVQFAQGVLFKTWKGRFGINTALVNGGGNNRTDDNMSLDVILGGEVHIADWLQCRAGTQFGKQPDGWRSAGIISADLYLSKRLTTIVNLAYHKERDIRSNGWYIRCLYDLTKNIRLVGNAIQRTQDREVILEKDLLATHTIESTIGMEVTRGPIKTKLNLIATEKKVGFAAELQIQLP